MVAKFDPKTWSAQRYQDYLDGQVPDGPDITVRIIDGKLSSVVHDPTMKVRIVEEGKDVYVNPER